MTNKKENKNITVDLVNNTKNKDISKINLSTNEKHLYNKVVGHNKEGNSINKDVATLLKTGKKGVESIERIAKALKDNKEPLNAYKMAVSRFYKDMPKENKLSLQGLGAKNSPFIGKPSKSGSNSKKTKAVKTNIDSVNTFIDKMVDSERVEYIFDLVDTLSNVDKKAMIEWLISEVKKVA
jgi:hypothetical protein